MLLSRCRYERPRLSFLTSNHQGSLTFNLAVFEVLSRYRVPLGPQSPSPPLDPVYWKVRAKYLRSGSENIEYRSIPRYLSSYLGLDNTTRCGIIYVRLFLPFACQGGGTNPASRVKVNRYGRWRSSNTPVDCRLPVISAWG
jgi:hypothetical protein